MRFIRAFSSYLSISSVRNRATFRVVLAHLFTVAAKRADSTWYRRIDLSLLTTMWVFATVQGLFTCVLALKSSLISVSLSAAYEWHFARSIFIWQAETRESSFDFSSSDHLDSFNTTQQVLKQVNILLADWISVRTRHLYSGPS